MSLYFVPIISNVKVINFWTTISFSSFSCIFNIFNVCFIEFCVSLCPFILCGFMISDIKIKIYCITVSFCVFLIIFSFFFFWPHHVGSYFPNLISNLCPLHWEFRVLTTGRPGKSHWWPFMYLFILSLCLLTFTL